MKNQEQPQLPDLTKILRVGDKVWYCGYGEREVVYIRNTKNDDRPIGIRLFKNNWAYLTLDGRTTEKDNHPIIYPIDQAPPTPQWPTQPQTFEWEGEVYEVGEFVAVRDRDADNWTIFKLLSLDEDEVYPVKVSKGGTDIRFAQMRKLPSFNQDQEPQD